MKCGANTILQPWMQSWTYTPGGNYYKLSCATKWTLLTVNSDIDWFDSTFS